MQTNLESLARAKVDEAARQLVTYLPLANASAAPFIEMGASEAEKLHAARVSAVLARAALVPRAMGNPFDSYDLPALARDAVERAGVNASGRTVSEVVAMALTTSTSDFPTLLKDIGTKALLRGYDEASESYSAWTSVGSLRDFKPAARVGLGAFPNLDQVAENQPYQTAVLNDQGETTQLLTFGKMWTVSRALIVSDDLDTISRVPRSMGRAAARAVGDLAYSVLTNNAAMADGIALFHATHGNLAAVAAAPSTASIDAIRAAMVAQIDNGVRLGIRPRFLLVPTALEGTARAAINSSFFTGDGVVDMTRPNGTYGIAEIVADHRLDAASATAWYAIGDPAKFDGVELSYLDGNQVPYLEQQRKFSVDGGAFRVRIDVAAKALDWRALSKNAGA